MTNNTNTEALIQRYYKAMNGSDLNAVWDCYADNIVYEDVALGHKFIGLEATKRFYTEYMSALEVVNHIESLVTTDDSYAIGWRIEGIHSADLPDLPATHRSYQLRGASIGKVVDGKIIQNSDFWNLSSLLTQLGLQ
ncbi:MAG: ester cyclase [Tissierellales bacterium]